MEPIERLLIKSAKKQDWIYEALTRGGEKRVLDLGCSIPFAFMNLYHLYGITDFVGVDNVENEHICILEYIQRVLRSNTKDSQKVANQLKGLSTFFSVYDSIIDESNDIKTFFPRIVEKKTFDRLITQKILFGTSLHKFLKEVQPSIFDLIISSNVFHFFLDMNTQRELFEKLVYSIKPRGILYFKISYRNHLLKDEYLYLMRECMPGCKPNVIEENGQWSRIELLHQFA